MKAEVRLNLKANRHKSGNWSIVHFLTGGCPGDRYLFFSFQQQTSGPHLSIEITHAIVKAHSKMNLFKTAFIWTVQQLLVSGAAANPLEARLPQSAYCQ